MKYEFKTIGSFIDYIQTSSALMSVGADLDKDGGALLKQILHDLPVAAYFVDLAGILVFYNRAAEVLAGRTPQLGVDKWCVGWKLYRPDGSPLRHEECPVAVALREGRTVRGAESVVERPDGTRVPVIPYPTPIRDAQGVIVGILNVLLDISERKRFERQADYVARHDPLTHLPNRIAFSERLARAIDGAERLGVRVAVACIDLDHFKDVNDTFGHVVGDHVLRVVADRLRKAAPGVFFARIGGDSLAAIMPTVSGEREILARLEELQAAVGRAITVGGHSIHVAFTAGIAICPRHGADEIVIMANADAALVQAKHEARGSIRIYDGEIAHRLQERTWLRTELHGAIAREEMQIYYQPLVTRGGEIAGFEALLRWIHRQRGEIPPKAFIPVAEECGLILPLSRWLLGRTCRDAASWPRPLRVSVNVSAVQFQHEDLPGLVGGVLEDAGLPPNRLELEITESALIGDSERARAALEGLRALGVGISLDDFGTGYSSLSYLCDFPISRIKIDRSFVAKLGEREQARTIVRAMIGLGQTMGLGITAEGIETAEQLEFMHAEGCDMFQGYLLGIPGPIHGLASLIERCKASEATPALRFVTAA